MTHEQIVFYQGIGICPYCQKEKLWGEERQCLKCSSKSYAWQRSWNERNPGYKTKKRMEQYYKRKEEHKCVSCGSDLPEDYSRTMCDKCRIKNNRYSISYRRRVMANENRS